MPDWEPYAIQVIPLVTLAGIYAIAGFELATVMGLGMVVGAVSEP